MSKEKLIDYLERHGKDKSWFKLAEQFDIKPYGNYDARRRTAKRIWDNYLKTVTITRDDIIDDYTPDISIQDGMYLVLGCVHAPFVNIKLWKAMLQLAETYKHNIKGLIIAGDFLDLNSLSSHDKGKVPVLKNINLGWEYEQSLKYLKSIEDVLEHDIYKAYLYGNHEDRFNRYLSSVDNSKLGTGLKSPIDGLKLQERNYDIYTNWKMDKVQLGDLHIYHGESCSKHCSFTELQLEKQSVLFFHTHRVQSHAENRIQAYNAGSMADFNAPIFNYASKSMRITWKNAFAVCTLHKNKTSVETIQWHNNHFVYGGKVFQ